MKTKGVEDTPVTAIGVKDSGTFRIRPSAKAFKILSDGLYSNKIQAIVRELSCNARDSHIAAGKADLPFDVHLPNGLESWFAVRDYGVGLNHEEVMTIYTTYFESTKSDSNDYIGALGLGSKSPFSYTDQFTVTAIKDSVKRIYCAYLQEGIPSISLMSESETDEGNGVEVRVDIKNTDYSAFMREASNVYCWFDLKPNLSGATGFTIKSVPTLTINGKEMNLPCRTKMIDTSGGQMGYGYHGGMIAIQGGVAYKVDLPRQELIPRHLQYLLRYVFASWFDIGELDVAPSREALSYDEATVKAIVNRYEQIHKEMIVAIKQSLKEGTPWQMVSDINALSRLFYGMGDVLKETKQAVLKKLKYSSENITWNQNIYADLAILESDIKKEFKNLYSVDYTGKLDNNWSSMYDRETNPNQAIEHRVFTINIPTTVSAHDRERYSFEDTINIFVVDSSAFNARIKEFFKKNYTDKQVRGTTHNFVFTPLDGETAKDTDKKIAAFLKNIGSPKVKVIRTSTLPKPDKKATENLRAGSVLRMSRHVNLLEDGPVFSFTRLTTEQRQEFDKKDKIYYLPLSNTTVDDLRVGHPDMLSPQMLGALFTGLDPHQRNNKKNMVYSLLPNVEEFYGIRKSEIHIVKDNPKFINLLDVLFQNYEKFFTKDMVVQNVNHLLLRKHTQELYMLDGVQVKTSNPDVNEYLEMVRTTTKLRTHIHNNDVLELTILAYQTFCKAYKKVPVVDLKQQEKKILELKEKILSKYPILKFVERQGYHEVSNKMTNAVIDLVG